MVECKSFQMFLILMIPFTAVTQHRSFIIVTVGDEATLPCKDVKDYQIKCLSTTWIFNYFTTGPTVTLFEYGKIHREAAAKSDRLSVTEKCSLVIKTVTYEDAGRYICRQFRSGQTITYSDVNLIVTYMTQHYYSITVRVGVEVTLPCKDVNDYHDKCSRSTWTFNYLTTAPTVPLFEYGKIHREAAAKSDRLSVTEKCSLVIKNVTDEDVGRYNCRQFISRHKVTDAEVDLSVLNRVDGAIASTSSPKTTELPTTTKTTTKETEATTRPAKPPPTTTTSKLPTTTKTTTKATNAATEKSRNADLPAIMIPVAVVLAALLVIMVAVIRWKRAKENNTRLDDNTADPPDGVSYASIRYKKKTNSEARVQGGDDTVTYSTLNTSSTSAGASTDPRNLYASINKTKA